MNRGWPEIDGYRLRTPSARALSQAPCAATSRSSSPALVVLPASALEVLPGHTLVLLAGIAQQEGRMERRDEHRVAERVQPATQLADRFLRAQQRLGRDAAEREDDLRLDHGELVGQKRRARGELVCLGIAVAGRPAQDRVRDEDFVARQVHRGQHLRQQLSRAADERQALRVLVGAGAFANDDELGARIAGAEHDVRAALAELTAPAALQRLLLTAQHLGRRHQVFALERHRLDAEVAIEAQRLGQSVERSGQRLACGVAQREALSAGRPAARRSARISLRMASATALFVMRGSARLPPQRSIRSTSLSSASKPMPARLTSLATRRSMPLASSLARALAATSFVSAAKPTTNAPERTAATSARMSGLGVNSSVRSRLPLILISDGRRTR